MFKPFIPSYVRKRKQEMVDVVVVRALKCVGLARQVIQRS